MECSEILMTIEDGAVKDLEETELSLGQILIGQGYYECDEQQTRPRPTGTGATEAGVVVVGTGPQPQEACSPPPAEEESLGLSLGLFNKELFIEEVRKHKCLWDVNSEQYKNRAIKVNAWKTIGEIFNREVEFLQRQLKNLKDTLKKCLNKRNSMIRSGAAATSLPQCKYFEQMRFLHEKTANKPTVSNCQATSSGTTTRHASNEENIDPCVSTIPQVPIKRKKQHDELDTMIINQLETTSEAINSLISGSNQQEDEVALYFRSLIPIVSAFDCRRQRLAMVKISQLLFDIEFEE
ncbi:uncharacterized protein [Antedon mediterranea]|uniref:uncharacterized protein n=1 Tax=Antedon mediterranea TaxID=105859 RepID=UPI003AF8EA6D